MVGGFLTLRDEATHHVEDADGLTVGTLNYDLLVAAVDDDIVEVDIVDAYYVGSKDGNIGEV